MGSNGADEVMVSGSGNTLCPEPTVEIKIKTLDSQTYTLRVDKCVPVPALKEQIAGVTGVLSEQQRLICRGKVLKDDQLLSAYHVEDGHTLHLVVRQPNQPPFDGSVDHSANGPASSSTHQSNQSGPGVVIGTFNISEPGGGGLPDLHRIVSAVLGSFGVANDGSGIQGDLDEFSLTDLLRTAHAGLANPGGHQTDQTAANGPSYPAASFSVSAPLDPLQLPVIPDSLTTLSQYLARMRTEFRENVRDQVNSFQRDDGLVSDGRDSSFQRDDGLVSDGRDSSASDRSASGGLPTAAVLAEVLLSTRQLLIHQSADSISVLAGQLVDQANMTDMLGRVRTQGNALGTGMILQHLGALLMELGRTTMTLRMGQTPAESVVNAGPAVFISTSGPNPIMVQPLHFQHGASFGAIPTGTGEHGLSGGSIGSGFLSRNIDIRIRTASQSEATGVQQSLGQSNQSTPDTGISFHVDAPVASGIPSSIRGSEVRVIPIRTVVAALPASLRRSSADTSRTPRSFIPVVARVQRVSSGNLVNQRTRQSADGVRSGSLGSEQQPNSNHTLPQEGTELSGANANVSAGDATQNSQGFSTDIPSSFDQLLRTIFPGEHIHISDVNLQGMGSGSGTSDSRTNQGATAAAATSAQESSAATGDDGVFLSNLLRQIMPVISENTAGGSTAGEADDTGNRDTETSSIQGQENTDSGTGSRRRGNRPSSPASKRQRR